MNLIISVCVPVVAVGARVLALAWTCADAGTGGGSRKRRGLELAEPEAEVDGVPPAGDITTAGYPVPRHTRASCRAGRSALDGGGRLKGGGEDQGGLDAGRRQGTR